MSPVIGVKSKPRLVGVLHQHRRIWLVLLREQTDVVLAVESGAIRLVLNGLEVQ